jgi:hypothetical protein
MLILIVKTLFAINLYIILGCNFYNGIYSSRDIGLIEKEGYLRYCLALSPLTAILLWPIFFLILRLPGRDRT